MTTEISSVVVTICFPSESIVNEMNSIEHLFGILSDPSLAENEAVKMVIKSREDNLKVYRRTITTNSLLMRTLTSTMISLMNCL